MDTLASTLEINLAIAQLEYYLARIDICDEGVTIIETGDYVNYCESWEDMGPIIEREQIQIGFCDRIDRWEATHRTFKRCIAKTPLRAAALCYLKLKDL